VLKDTPIYLIVSNSFNTNAKITEINISIYLILDSTYFSEQKIFDDINGDFIARLREIHSNTKVNN
jgi:hypothetical protein